MVSVLSPLLFSSFMNKLDVRTECTLTIVVDDIKLGRDVDKAGGKSHPFRMISAGRKIGQQELHVV